MASDQIKFDSGQMKDVGGGFTKASTSVKELTDMLKKSWDPLDGGQQWLGQAANNAKAEMATVFKELKNLENALNDSSQGVKDITAEFESADSEVGSIWKALAAALSSR